MSSLFTFTITSVEVEGLIVTIALMTFLKEMRVNSQSPNWETHLLFMKEIWNKKISFGHKLNCADISFFNTSVLHTCTLPYKCDYFYNYYLPTSRIGRGPNLSIRIPSGSVVALSKKEPMVKPKFSISSWSTQLSHSSASPPEEVLPEDTITESFTVESNVESVIREVSVRTM